MTSKLQGFVLLEALMATAIAAVIFVGIMGAAQSRVATTAYLEQKVAAIQVAANLATELSFLDLHEIENFDEDIVSMGIWEFRWTRTVEPHDEEQYEQIHIKIFNFM